MFCITNEMERQPKKRPHMRGIRTPRIFVMILGCLHRKREKLKVEDGTLSSPYLEKKQKDFSAYCSEMYKLTATLLQGMCVKEDSLSEKVNTLTEGLAVLLNDFSNQKDETIQEKRKKARLSKRIQECRTELDAFQQELKETQIIIAESELETKEMILEQKSRAEALIVVYLDGGGYPAEGMGFELLGDRPAVELYHQYIGERERPEQIEKREVDTYVVKDI